MYTNFTTCFIDLPLSLSLFQVVHTAEEQAHLMASQDSGIDEISRTHQQILDMVRMPVHLSLIIMSVVMFLFFGVCFWNNLVANAFF